MAQIALDREQYQLKSKEQRGTDSITLSLNDSFFQEKGRDTTVEEYF